VGRSLVPLIVSAERASCNSEDGGVTSTKGDDGFDGPGELGRSSIGWSLGEAYGDREEGDVGVPLPPRPGDGVGVGEGDVTPVPLGNSDCIMGEPPDIERGLPIPFGGTGLPRVDDRRNG